MVVPRLPDGSVALGGIRDLVAAIEGCEGHAQIRSLVRLADTMGTTMAIEHINHFLRALKQKVAERAAQGGVRPAGSALASPRPQQPAPAAAAPAGAAPATAAQPAMSKVAAPVMGKGPAKAPPSGLAKVPSVAKTPAVVKTAAPVMRPAVAKTQPPAQPRPQAPSSPQASSEEDLLALVSFVSENPVVVDGALDEARLNEVLGKLWGGSAQKTKDWIAAWQAMTIPVDKQAEALNKFLSMTFVQGADSDRAPSIVAELVKAHKVKMRSVEEVLVAFGNNLDGIMAMNENAWHVYAHFLMHIFPKPQGTGWGWSRVGWSWQSWFKYVEQCLQSLEGPRASDVLCMVLRLLQEREGQALAETQTWSEGDKLQRFVGKIAELGGVEAADAVEKLAEQGVAVQLA